MHLDEELFLMGIEEPINFAHGVKERSWKAAMDKEMQSIEENNTWRLTKVLLRKKVIRLKWIFKLKNNAEEIILKNKARLVAKGYM